MRPDLSSTSLSRKDLCEVDLSRCSLTGTHLNNTQLNNANLKGANLASASLQGARLRSADLREANLGGANLAGVDLTEGNLANALLSSAHAAHATFRLADLTGADAGKINLFEANLSEATMRASKFHWANLTRVNLRCANLRRSDLTGATLIDADLSGADLSWANLRYARLIDSTLENTNLSDARVYGISAWNLRTAGAKQTDLIITPPDESKITVDNLEIAQFIYVLLNSEKVRQTLTTITSKLVLILGRFTPERLTILDGIREALRSRDYLPLLFDFAGPSSRDITETISTLAHLARFVIADITDARGVPQELMAIVPNLPSVPVQPLLLASQREYGMFGHFRRYPWVLDVFVYSDLDTLLSSLNEKVIAPAEHAISRRPEL